MKKYKAHDRANILLGDMISINQRELDKLKLKLEKASTPAQIKKIKKSIDYWSTTPTKFKFDMEEVCA